MSERTLFGRLRAGLRKTRQALQERLEAIFSRPRVDANTLEALEEALILADVGVRATARVLQEATARLRAKTLQGGEDLRQCVMATLRDILEAATPPPATDPLPRPWVLMLVGVNGVGKTTTLGKLAYQYRQAGERPLLVAADTFRAAAIEQAVIWAERAGVEVVKGQPGGDAAAVAFDALQAACARHLDRVLIDTAGRLHTKAHLMQELAKMRRVIARALPGAPHEVWLVLDATTGQNGLVQAQQFHEQLGLTGLVLTKLDGTAKGGIVVHIAEQLRLPIRYLGVGEGLDDLRPFDAQAFAEALLEYEPIPERGSTR
ncbi:MAG: signal recognition particle receptor FtsY [Candidatus Tectimicrobiota bacterium]|nr:MAG: signal recognition particle receptor FtsY [Candidatus Tectomicrobia bacterium]